MLALGLVVALLAAQEARAEHVVVVSIDGLRPDFYLGDFEAPVLKEIVVRGASADEVEGVFPSVTYPSHTTIATGVRPWKHGIYANQTWGERGATRDWHWHERDVKARTLWQAAKDRGLRVAILNWPCTVGSKVDWLLAEIWDPDGKETVQRVAKASTPSLLAELALGVGIPAEKFSESKAAQDDFVARAAAYVFKRRLPHLTMVHLIAVDDTQHREGPRSAAAKEAVAKVDAQVGRIRAAIASSPVADRTVLLVVGDHGFSEVARNVNPNALLRDEGWVEVDAGKVSGWKALARSSGGSAGVYVKDPADVPKVAVLLRKAAVWKGETLYRVIERAELDGLGYNPEAALALDPEPGWAVSGALAIRPVDGIPTVKGNHGQVPTRPGLQTGLLAEGPGVKPGTRLGKLRLVDIAPTVGRLLGLEMPAGEGASLPGVAP